MEAPTWGAAIFPRLFLSSRPRAAANRPLWAVFLFSLLNAEDFFAFRVEHIRTRLAQKPCVRPQYQRQKYEGRQRKEVNAVRVQSKAAAVRAWSYARSRLAKHIGDYSYPVLYAAVRARFRPYRKDFAPIRCRADQTTRAARLRRGRDPRLCRPLTQPKGAFDCVAGSETLCGACTKHGIS